jgi:hypothetical protein
MKVSLSPEFKIIYPKPIFGSLVAKDVPNTRKNKSLESLKRDIKRRIRVANINIENDSVLQTYNLFFKREGKTYPVEFQL